MTGEMKYTHPIYLFLFLQSLMRRYAQTKSETNSGNLKIRLVAIGPPRPVFSSSNKTFAAGVKINNIKGGYGNDWGSPCTKNIW
jgi:hypothetical protein